MSVVSSYYTTPPAENWEYVGFSGSGVFTQSGGTNNSIVVLALGYRIGSSGTYNLSGGQVLVDEEWVGSQGSGTFTQSGGTNTLLGYQGNGDPLQVNNGGTYSLTGGFLSSPTEGIGWFSEGNFTQTGGINAVTNALDVGGYYYNGSATGGGPGTYSLSGRGHLSAPTEIVGYTGQGTFTQTGGTNTVSGTLYLSWLPGGSGTYNLDGGQLVVWGISQGTGNAVFNFNGGTLQASDSFATNLPMAMGTSGGGATFDTNGFAVTLGGSLSGPGSLTKVDSGTLVLAAANTYSGNTLIGGGTLALGSPLALQQSTLDTSGGGVLSFGTLTAATFGGLTGSGNLALSNATSSAVTLSVGNNNASTTYSGTLSGPGSLTKIGSGTLILTATNTSSGPTTINQGELLVNGSLVSPVTVNSGILGGSGTLSTVTVSPSGAIAPGSPPGTLTLSGSLILSSGAMLDYDLDTPSTSGMIACGPVIASSLEFSNFSFENAPNFRPGVYDLIQSNTSLPPGLLGGSTSGSVGPWQANLAVQGNDLVLTVVPEPGTLALLAASTLVLAVSLLRRRRIEMQPSSPHIFRNTDLTIFLI